MDVNRISWRQTAPSRWVGRDSDGYSLRVAETRAGWKWSVHPPGAGYDVGSGLADTREAAIEAAKASYSSLQEEIARSFEAGLRRRYGPNYGKRRD